MGIKKLKEQFNIEHIVQIRSKKVCIGSSYIGDIIQICPTSGEIVKFYKDRKYNDGWNTNENLKRYQEEIIAFGPENILKLLNEKDQFNKLYDVYTHKGSKIIKKQAENIEWPNTTTDGELIYENTFFSSWFDAYKSLKDETKIRYIKGYLRELRSKIKQVVKYQNLVIDQFLIFIKVRTILYFSYLIKKIFHG